MHNYTELFCRINPAQVGVLPLTALLFDGGTKLRRNFKAVRSEWQKKTNTLAVNILKKKKAERYQRDDQVH